MVFGETEDVEILLDRSDGIVGDVVCKTRLRKDGLDNLAGDADRVVWFVVKTAANKGGHGRGEIGGTVCGVGTAVDGYDAGVWALRSIR